MGAPRPPTHQEDLNYKHPPVWCGGERDVFIFTGLEHVMPLAAADLEFADDEIGPALSYDRLKRLTLEHLGGAAETHDIAVFNRLTGATMATHLTLVKPGEVVIGVSESHSHPRSCARPTRPALGLSTPPALPPSATRSPASVRHWSC